MKQLALALLAAAAGCGGTAGEPTNFGVNLHVLSSALSTAQRQAIVAATLHVTGDGPQFDAMLTGFNEGLASGELRFHYAPLMMSGTLGFQLDTFTATTATKPFLSASSLPITLAPSAVDAMIVLVPLRCSDFVSCLLPCADAPCMNNCKLAASSSAIAKQAALESCVNAICAAPGGPCSGAGGGTPACSDCGAEATTGTSPTGMTNGPCVPVATAPGCGQCVAQQLACDADPTGG